MQEQNKISETGCCPKFNPEPWDGKEIVWNKKNFVKDHVNSFFHIPLNFGKVITRNCEKIEKSHAYVVDNVILSDESSLWGSDLYFSVDKDIPDSENVLLDGTYLTKVYEGSYKDAGKWMKDMNAYVSSKGKKAKKIYHWYTTCPKCAKVYGKNYTVLFAEV